LIELAERDIQHHLKYLMIYPSMKPPTFPYVAYQPPSGFETIYRPQHMVKTEKDLRWYDYDLNEVIKFPTVVELTVLIDDLETGAGKKSKQRVEKGFSDLAVKKPGFRYPKLNFQEYADLEGMEFGKNWGLEAAESEE
jgi:hypothetical protein